MISRVADACFWLGRYLERAEATARLLYVTRHLSLDAELEPAQCWWPVVIVCGEEPHFVEQFGGLVSNEGAGEQVELYMTWDEANFSSIRSSVHAARENARSIREVISLEVWESLNELYLWLGSDAARAEYEGARYSFYRHIRQYCQLTTGLMRSTMLHDLPLNFIWLGMLLERGGQTARVVDVHHHALTTRERTREVFEAALWLSLLRACSGMEPFLKRHRSRVTGDAVATFLIFEPLFPKSIAYSVHEAWTRFTVIRPPEEPSLPGGETLVRLAALDRWVNERSADGTLGDVHALCTHVVDEIAAICTGLSRELFGQVGSPAVESSQ
jgi:uncharacterized alpha-E superfamily protein